MCKGIFGFLFYLYSYLFGVYLNMINILNKLYPYTIFGLSLYQIQDGISTYWGTNEYGSIIEGNPLMRNLMELIGINPTLIIVKLFALLIICAIYKYNTKPTISLMLMIILVFLFYTYACITWMLFHFGFWVVKI